MKNEPLNPKTVSSTINTIRDKYCKQLTAKEQQALIIAENIIREHPELVVKYL